MKGFLLLWSRKTFRGAVHLDFAKKCVFAFCGKKETQAPFQAILARFFSSPLWSSQISAARLFCLTMQSTFSTSAVLFLAYFLCQPRWHVTAGNLRKASSFLHVSFVVGHFPNVLCRILAVLCLHVLDIFWLVSKTNRIGKTKTFQTNQTCSKRHSIPQTLEPAICSNWSFIVVLGVRDQKRTVDLKLPVC